MAYVVVWLVHYDSVDSVAYVYITLRVLFVINPAWKIIDLYIC